MVLNSIIYKDNHLKILDQLLLPHCIKYIAIKSVEDAYHAIKSMQVRGAPAIAIVGCLGLAIELKSKEFIDVVSLKKFVLISLDYLVSSRPTAVNMKRGANDIKEKLKSLIKEDEINVDQIKESIISFIELMLEKDVADNKAIGKHGAESILSLYPQVDKLNILTHCNTGSLATAGYGTALGVIRALHEQSRIGTAYCTETRPYNQGARLTAFELVYEKIPAKLICDSSVSILLKTKKIHGIVVGADRIAVNGDTANKIGTYQLAVSAKHHNVPFYVAAPWTSIDMNISSGDEIVIEERSSEEMTHVGDNHIAAEGIECWNPAFDVTPAELITEIITEINTFKPNELQANTI